MDDQPGNLTASTTSASAATAQSSYEAPYDSTQRQRAEGEIPGPCAKFLDVRFHIGPGVSRASLGRPYVRRSTDPIYRPLRIYALDPAVSQLDGAVALVNVPYEPLGAGPTGSIFEVCSEESLGDGDRPAHGCVDLDDPMVLIRNGCDPSTSDRYFHQQMVYAIASLIYAAFRHALGRSPTWGFAPRGKEEYRLRLRPHATSDRNAYYDNVAGEICFGYYSADRKTTGRNLPGGCVFTCLSHDIIVHEVTHALLDGMRARFLLPTGPDVLAFHEGFADLIALFHHFSFEELLRHSIRSTGGEIGRAESLRSIALQFGQTTGMGEALRVASGETIDEPMIYDEALEPHKLGEILMSAVFEAFITVFKRKTARFIRLATGGSGILGKGEMPIELQDLLAEEASKLASHFLSICIRAIDYCPPIDLKLGEYLRAMISADHDLIPDDRWGYREALTDAFRRRAIYPNNTGSLSTDALLWAPPRPRLDRIGELSFTALGFHGDPGQAADARELQRQACVLGEYITRPAHIRCFGLAPHGMNDGDEFHRPCIQSIRSSRRVGPDGQVIFDLVAEVTQKRTVCRPGPMEGFEFYGGATIILGPDGEIRYIIRKGVTDDRRLDAQFDYATGAGRRYWMKDGKRLVPETKFLRLLHDHAQAGTDH